MIKKLNKFIHKLTTTNKTIKEEKGLELFNTITINNNDKAFNNTKYQSQNFELVFEKPSKYSVLKDIEKIEKYSQDITKEFENLEPVVFNYQLLLYIFSLLIESKGIKYKNNELSASQLKKITYKDAAGSLDIDFLEAITMLVYQKIMES